MAGFMAGLAKGVEQGLNRLERQEAREQELAFKKAQAASAERRFKLQYEEDKKQTEFARKKYFLEKRIEERKAQKQAHRDYIDDVVKGRTSLPEPSYTIREKESQVTGELDDQEVGPEALYKTNYRRGDTPYFENKKFQDALDNLGYDYERIKKLVGAREAEARLKRIKSESEASNLRNPDVKDTLEKMSNGEIAMIPENHSFWQRARDVSPHFTFSNIRKVNNLHRKQKITERDQKALNEGEIIPLTAVYPAFRKHAVDTDNELLSSLFVLPIMKDGKVQQFFDRSIFSKHSSQITKNDEELMVKFMTMLDGSLGDSKRISEDSYQRLIKTFNSSPRLKNDIVKTYMHFNEKQIELAGGMSDGYTLDGRRILNQFQNLKNIVTPLLQDGKVDLSKDFPDGSERVENLKIANNSGSLESGVSKPEVEAEIAKNTPPTNFNQEGKDNPVFNPNVGPTEWAIRFAVKDQSKLVRHLSMNSPKEVRDAITRMRMQDWGSNIDPNNYEGQQRIQSTKDDQKNIARYLIKYAKKHKLNEEQLNQLAVGLVTGNFVYHNFEKGVPGKIRQGYNVLDVKSKAYKDIQSAVQSSDKGIKNVQDLIFLFMSNDKLMDNVMYNEDYTQGGQTFKSMTSLTSGFANTLNVAFGEAKEILGFLDDDKATSKILNTGGIEFTKENRDNMEGYLQTYMKAAKDNIEKEINKGLMNDRQLEIYSQIQLQKVKLAYTLAGVFQGGSSGSRTISDQDFKIIMRALWSPNERVVRANLRELYHSLHFAKSESIAAQTLSPVTGLHVNVRDAMYNFGKILREEIENQNLNLQISTEANFDNTAKIVSFQNPLDLDQNITFNTQDFNSLVSSDEKPLTEQQIKEYMLYKYSLSGTVLKAMHAINHAATNIDYRENKLFGTDGYTPEKYDRLVKLFNGVCRNKTDKSINNLIRGLPRSLFQQYSLDKNKIFSVNWEDFNDIDSKLNKKIGRIADQEDREFFTDYFNEFQNKLYKSNMQQILNFKAGQRN